MMWMLYFMMILSAAAAQMPESFKSLFFPENNENTITQFTDNKCTLFMPIHGSTELFIENGNACLVSMSFGCCCRRIPHGRREEGSSFCSDGAPVGPRVAVSVSGRGRCCSEPLPDRRRAPLHEDRTHTPTPVPCGSANGPAQVRPLHSPGRNTPACQTNEFLYPFNAERMAKL
ncbi:hypothetical protein CEXT_14681 [Caerostris extrusa]|uniref:Uncharacterized protein n=1 Tax=Caerostris extrusa TaxID=172846 RepID=A0AAV4VHD7_CAEEX|nr:hypothetical protein CEXT_14681 [Caerostris extrusa]